MCYGHVFAIAKGTYIYDIHIEGIGGEGVLS